MLALVMLVLVGVRVRVRMRVWVRVRVLVLVRGDRWVGGRQVRRRRQMVHVARRDVDVLRHVRRRRWRRRRHVGDMGHMGQVGRGHGLRWIHHVSICLARGKNRIVVV